MKTARPLLLLSAALMFAPAPLRSQDPGRQVLEIFRHKCTECHGSTVRKPKGKFGFVEDLNRVREKYSPSRKLEDSDIWYYLAEADEDEIMPPGKAKNGPLSPAQLDVVKRWVLAGAPAPLTTGKTADEVAAQPSGSAAGMSAIDLLAALHPLLVHFPIALILAALLLEFRQGGRMPSWRAPIRALLVMVVLSAPLAALAGLLAQAREGYADATVQAHKWFGLSGTALAVLACWQSWRMAKSSTEDRRLLFRLLLFLAALLIGLAGHEGGILVHGPLF